MKKLDEVIAYFDNQTQQRHVYLTEDAEDIYNDALHYLKVLKDILDPLKVKKISHEITCPQCNSVIGILLPESNDPLTWDELREMNGKPVWVEMDGYAPVWGIIMNQDKRNGRLCLCGYDKVPIRIEINEDGEGKTWHAYRKERL